MNRDYERRRDLLLLHADSPPPWTPAAVPGYELDLDATKGITLDAGRVSAWIDQSGKGHNCAQATAGQRPTVDLLGGFGVEAVHFDASNQILPLTTPIAGLAAAHVFAVVRSAEDPALSTQNQLWEFGSTTNPTLFTYTDSNIYDGFGTTSRKTVGNPAASLAAVRCYEVYSASGEWTANLDGTQVFTTSTNTVGWAAAQALGSKSGTINQGYIGWIARLIVYSQRVTGADLVKLKALISQTYGVTFA